MWNSDSPNGITMGVNNAEWGVRFEPSVEPGAALYRGAR